MTVATVGLRNLLNSNFIRKMISGLEDQLLAEVVKADRPDLEEQKADLTRY